MNKKIYSCPKCGQELTHDVNALTCIDCNFVANEVALECIARLSESVGAAWGIVVDKLREIEALVSNSRQTSPVGSI